VDGMKVKEEIKRGGLVQAHLQGAQRKPKPRPSLPDFRGEEEQKRGENHGPNRSLKEKECERWPNECGSNLLIFLIKIILF
jgi:hypothetical protein